MMVFTKPIYACITKWRQGWLTSTQVGSMRIIRDSGWTKWRAVFKWTFVCNVWSTARCHRSVTRTTTVLLTRRASSTRTTLHSSLTRPTLSLTTLGPGGVQSFAMSSKRHRMPAITLLSIILQNKKVYCCSDTHIYAFIALVMLLIVWLIDCYALRLNRCKIL